MEKVLEIISLASVINTFAYFKKTLKELVDADPTTATAVYLLKRENWKQQIPKRLQAKLQDKRGKALAEYAERIIQKANHIACLLPDTGYSMGDRKSVYIGQVVVGLADETGEYAASCRWHARHGQVELRFESLAEFEKVVVQHDTFYLPITKYTVMVPVWEGRKQYHRFVGWQKRYCLHCYGEVVLIEEPREAERLYKAFCVKIRLLRMLPENMQRQFRRFEAHLLYEAVSKMHAVVDKIIPPDFQFTFRDVSRVACRGGMWRWCREHSVDCSKPYAYKELVRIDPDVRLWLLHAYLLKHNSSPYPPFRR